MSYYYCEICDQKFKTATGSKSKRHLDSKKHQKALETLEPKAKPDFGNELLLYNAMHKLKDPTYSNILKLFSSFGIKSEVTLKTIIKKLRERDIIIKGNYNSDYNDVLQIIINFQNFEYPITLTIKEALEKFQSLGFRYAPELIQFFNRLSENYPELLTFSSSKLGELPDLITFRQIFINDLIFYQNNNWDL